MSERHKNHIEKSAEKEKPIPRTRDLIILDGRFAQYGGKLFSGNHAVRFIDDNLKIIIAADEWDRYVYEKPMKETLFKRRGRIFWQL